MRIFSFIGYKCDRKLFFAYLIVLSCAIISGIVLCTLLNFNVYLVNYASEYVFNVFNFKNFQLLFIRLLSAILYCYLFFLICYFTNYKYLVLIFVFLRGLIASVYTVIMVSIGAFGGVLVAVFVFVPSTIVSLFLCYLVCECCRNINKRYLVWFPALVALVDTVILLMLVNVIFRVVIIIV